MILTHNGKSRELQITGAASRYIPLDTLEAQRNGKTVGAKVRSASGVWPQDSNDAPASTGTFAGGAAASAVQSHRAAARDNRAAVELKDQP